MGFDYSNGFGSGDFSSGFGPGFGPGMGGEMDVQPFVEGAVAGVGGMILGVLIFVYLLMLAFTVVSYVLQSIGLYTIAKRRGIRNPWLSWLPIGECWILGSISDQYQYVAKGKVKNRRKVLLGLSVATCVAVLPMVFGVVIGLIITGSVGATFAGMILGYLLLLVMLVVLAVFRYIALYDLYVSCNPDSAVLFLVLGIFISVTMPFFLFASRKKDLGMPPRKQPEIPPEPVADDEDFE